MSLHQAKLTITETQWYLELIEWGPIFIYSIYLDDIMKIIFWSPDSSDSAWHLFIGNSNESLPGVEF